VLTCTFAFTAGIQANAASEMDPEGYDPALKALSGLISGKKRADTQFWTHAFQGMKVYLEV